MGSFGVRATVIALFSVGVSAIAIYVIYILKERFKR